MTRIYSYLLLINKLKQYSVLGYLLPLSPYNQCFRNKSASVSIRLALYFKVGVLKFKAVNTLGNPYLFYFKLTYFYFLLSGISSGVFYSDVW